MTTCVQEVAKNSELVVCQTPRRPLIFDTRHPFSFPSMMTCSVELCVNTHHQHAVGRSCGMLLLTRYTRGPRLAQSVEGRTSGTVQSEMRDWPDGSAGFGSE